MFMYFFYGCRYDTGIVSGALVLLADPDEFDLDTFQEELVVSITIAGSILGALCSSYWTDMYGRKPAILLSSFVFTVGAFCMALAPSITLLLVGRGIIGLGVGLSSMCVPLYLSECATREKRGFLVNCFNMALTGGQFVASITAGCLQHVDGGWRWMLGLAAIPSLIQLIGFMCMPESPRFLLKMSKPEEAWRVLCKIRGCISIQDDEDMYERRGRGGGETEEENGIMASHVRYQEYTSDHKDEDASYHNDDNDDDTNKDIKHNYYLHDQDTDNQSDSDNERNTKEEFMYMKSVIDAEANQQLTGYQGLKSLIQTPSTRRALIVGCALQAIQQLSGINTVMYYTATILILAGFNTTQAIWWASFVAFMNFAGTVRSLKLLHTMGRRKLLLFSLGATVCTLFLLGLNFYIGQQASTSLTGYGHDCEDYSYCFDCVVDANCGYCSSVTEKVVYTNGSSTITTLNTQKGCVPGDDDAANHHSNLQNFTTADTTVTYTCADNSDYHYNHCPSDPSSTQYLIFGSLILYILFFSLGLGLFSFSLFSLCWFFVFNFGLICIFFKKKRTTSMDNQCSNISYACSKYWYFHINLHKLDV